MLGALSKPMYLVAQGQQGGRAKETAKTEVKEGLNKAWVDCQKALKLADRVVEQASNVAGASPKLAKCLAELESATEATTKLVDDIGFAIKFFKKRDGAALSVDNAQAMTMAAARSLQDLLDSTRQVRALMPAKE